MLGKQVFRNLFEAVDCVLLERVQGKIFVHLDPEICILEKCPNPAMGALYMVLHNQALLNDPIQSLVTNIIVVNIIVIIIATMLN